MKVDGYETKVEGTTITNTYKNTETTEVKNERDVKAGGIRNENPRKK
nr:hypothetical protein [Bacillus dicomae]